MKVRIRCCCLLAVALLAVLAPAAQASFGVTEEEFEAGTCYVSSCTYASPKSQFYTQAAGHPPWGGTTFELNHHKGLLGEEPEGSIKRVRVDVAPGLAANPEALPKCSVAQFENDECPTDTQVGNNELTVVVAGIDTPLPPAPVYNLEPPPGLPLLFGIHVELKPVANEHIFLEGHVEWATDYHEWFEINNISKAIPLLKSKLNFEGRAGNGNFLTLPSECSSTAVSHIEVESWEGERSTAFTHTPVGVEGCNHVPFAPALTVTPETPHSDLPDGATITLAAPQKEAPEEINTSDIRDVHLKLPEGMTLNPPSANGLGTCTQAQFAAGACPSGSAVGSVDIETDLPPHSLTGAVYLGSPSGATITGPPFTLYLIANTSRGVSVRLQGQVTPDENGRLETTFLHNPQLPFSSLTLTLKGGPRAPLANPLGCGTHQTETELTAYSGGAFLSKTPFTTDNVSGGVCPSTLPFSLGQSTAETNHAGGAETAFTFNLAREQGQQYLSRLQTVLPPGLVGMIPNVPLCPEPQAASGSCGSASQIGTASVTVGSGSEPIPFSGPVYLTGPYGGAPFGLSVPVEAAIGNFDLGRVVTRAAIGVDPTTARVVATSSLPTIVKGVPLRLRTLSVTVNRPHFLLNPTNCGLLATDSALASTLPFSGSASSPFQVAGCSSLPFSPSFASESNRLTASRVNGVALKVSLAQPAHQANIHSVVAQLPLQLPSRLTTLQKACLPATFAANPRSCPAESLVGSVRAVTPVLPGAMTGPAYLVARGGANFPDLDLILEDDGVRVVLVGNTAIRNGVTTSTFASIPDVPVTSFELTLPAGPHSALSSFGNLCAKPLIMPTTITAQSGKQLKQNTRISVLGCGVRIVRRQIKGRYLLVTVQTYAPGRVVASGKNMRKVARRLRKPTVTTLKLRLSHRAIRALHRRHHKVRLKVSVLFIPSSKREPTVRATSAITSKR
jgi:hypothetical protein